MSLREHLKAAWQQTKVMPARLADAPELPFECSDLWRAFVAMRSSAPSGMGLSRIPFSEIDAFQRVTGNRLRAWEVDAIRRVDAAFVDVRSEKQ